MIRNLHNNLNNIYSKTKSIPSKISKAFAKSTHMTHSLSQYIMNTKKAQHGLSAVECNSHSLHCSGQIHSHGYSYYADHGYMQNVIVNRAINMIAHAAANTPIKMLAWKNGSKSTILDHPILDLLRSPNPGMSGVELFEQIYLFRQLSGNAYLLANNGESISDCSSYIQKIDCISPNDIDIIANDASKIIGYDHKISNAKRDRYLVDPITNACSVLHIKNFHPLSKIYGLSSLECAMKNIEEHNEANKWNHALLSQGARPSGAMVLKNDNITQDSFDEFKRSVHRAFAGAKNAGKVMIFTDDIEWKQLSLTPQEMDWLEAQNSAARNIALGIGIPPQLLGIPGDNTYSNLVEARIAFWEQTILPLVNSTLSTISRWFGNGLCAFNDLDSFELIADIDNIIPIAERMNPIYERLNNCKFLTVNEKRAILGLGEIAESSE